jgi:hypothetical protein
MHQVFFDCWVFNLLSVKELRAIWPLPGKWRTRNSSVGRVCNPAWEAKAFEMTRFANKDVTLVPLSEPARATRRRSTAGSGRAQRLRKPWRPFRRPGLGAPR